MRAPPPQETAPTVPPTAARHPPMAPPMEAATAAVAEVMEEAVTEAVGAAAMEVVVEGVEEAALPEVAVAVVLQGVAIPQVVEALLKEEAAAIRRRDLEPRDQHLRSPAPADRHIPRTTIIESLRASDEHGHRW